MARGSSTTITYGAYTLGGETGGAARVAQLDGAFSVVDSPETLAVSFRVGVGDDSSLANAKTAYAVFEAAFRQVRKDIVIAALGVTLLSLSQSGNTGFDSEPDVTIVEDYGLSRVYDVRISFGRPADYSGLAGRQTSTISIDFDASNRRIVNISGIYTALSNDDATAVYDNEVDAYCASVLSGLGGNYNLVSENPQHKETDKVLKWTRLYLERAIENYGVTIRNQEITIASVEQQGEWSYPIGRENPNNFTQWSAQYSADIDYEQQTDIGPLKTLWSGTILPAIINKIRGTSDEQLAVVESNPEYDINANKITGTVKLIGIVGSGPVMWRTTQQTVNDEGWVKLPLQTPKPFDHYPFAGPASRRLVVIEEGVWAGAIRPVAKTPQEVFESEEIGFHSGFSRGEVYPLTWVPLPMKETVVPLQTGLPSQGTISTWAIRREYAYDGITTGELAQIPEGLLGA